MNHIQHSVIALAINGKVMTGKDCVVTNFQISIENPDQVFFRDGTRLIRPVLEPRIMRGTIEFQTSNLEIFDDLFGIKEEKQIRNKKVDDCTPEELIFAARQKLKD